jgi:imidazolonepropionase-like amidohydrolase
MAWWSAVLLLAVALCSSHAAARPLPEKQTIAITDVTVIDVEHGRSLDSRTVLISDGHISAIVASRDAAIPASAISLSGRGKFLIPGLVDMHVHLFNLSSKRAPNDWTFPLFIANGVTGVRDMRADSPSITQVNAWRKRVNAGELASPHIFATGISVRGASPEDAARQVDAAKEAGADFIKVFSEVPENHWRAIIATAQSRSLPVAGHVPAGVPLLTAATAGQRSNEHLMQAYEACSSVEAGLLATRQGLAGDALAAKRDAQEAQALEAFDHAKCSRVAKSLAASGQVQVPTMVLANEDAMQKRGPPDSDERWRFLRADERERWQRFVAGYTADDAALEKLRHPIARKIVSIMHRAGVPIMTGTDSPMPGVYPGFSLHEEMAMLVDAGLTPREALRSATLVPAQFLGLAATTGSVDVGKRADLVLLDADPAKNIRNTRRIHAVLIDGRLLRRGDLDELLEETALAQSR